MSDNHEHDWSLNSWGIAWVEEFCTVCFDIRRRDRIPGEHLSTRGPRYLTPVGSAFTVRELIAALQKVRPDALVHVSLLMGEGSYASEQGTASAVVDRDDDEAVIIGGTVSYGIEPDGQPD